MDDIVELIEQTLHREHPCTCLDDYKNRNLVDPQCVWHEVQGDGELIAAVLAEHGLLAGLQLEQASPA